MVGGRLLESHRGDVMKILWVWYVCKFVDACGLWLLVLGLWMSFAYGFVGWWCLWVDGFCRFCWRHCFAGFVVFADSIVLLGLWVLIMVDGHWVFEICWVDGKTFFFSSFFCLFSWESHCSSIFSSSSQNLRKERERLLGLLGLGLLGSVVELAHWGWRGKWKWNKGAPTIIRGCLVYNFKYMYSVFKHYTHFFTHTYFHVCFQTIKHMFLSTYTKHLLYFHEIWLQSTSFVVLGRVY